MIKKGLITIGIILVLVIAALSIAPLFIDINKKLKPILVEALEKNLHAKVTMGDISLSLYRKVNFKIDSLRIVKDTLTADISDLSLIMPYSVLRQNPADWMKKIKMEILADEISVNNRKFVVNKFKSDLLKEENVVKLKNTTFNTFDGRGKSYLEMDFTQNLKAIFEFEVKDGKWPVETLKEGLIKKVPNIPKAKEMVADIDLDDDFESVKGNILIQNGITNIQNIEMNVPTSKANIKATGTINTKNALKLGGNVVVPLDNVPADLRNSDGRGKIPFEVLGSIDNPRVNWEKMIELVVHAYSKDEGKKIIKKEVERLKEKLKKDERLKDLIKDIKF